MQKIQNYFMGAASWVQSLLFLLSFVILLVLSGTLGSMFPPGLSSLVFGVLGCVSGLAILLFLKSIDANSWEIAGVSWQRKTISRFLTGVLIGLTVFASIVIALIGFSPLEIKFSPNVFDFQALLHLIPILPLALMEELGFRSYPQQLLARNYGIWASQFSIAAVFGIFHIFYGWSPLSAFMGPFVWAFLFGLSAIASKGIAVSTGIHFSLNLLQSLAGMKGKDHYSIFKLDYPLDTTQTAMAATERLGMWLQVVMFAVFILITYLYKNYFPAATRPFDRKHN